MEGSTREEVVVDDEEKALKSRGKPTFHIDCLIN